MVKDQQGKGLEKTTVSLLKAKDSSVVKLAVPDTDGQFTFQCSRIRADILVSASHVGYAPVYSKPFELSGSGDVQVPGMTISKDHPKSSGSNCYSRKSQ